MSCKNGCHRSFPIPKYKFAVCISSPLKQWDRKHDSTPLFRLMKQRIDWNHPPKIVTMVSLLAKWDCYEFHENLFYICWSFYLVVLAGDQLFPCCLTYTVSLWETFLIDFTSQMRNVHIWPQSPIENLLLKTHIFFKKRIKWSAFVFCEMISILVLTLPTHPRPTLG